MWEPVAGLLRGAGHVVLAPTLVGVGPREREGSPATNLTTHVQQVVSLIQDQAARRVVLVGHSYGGLVVEGVAATIPDRIAELVFVDTLRVAKGECGFDRLPAALAEYQRAEARSRGDGWKLPPMTLEEVGGIGSVEAGISVSDVERVLHEGRGTHPIGTFEERVAWDASSLAGVSRRYVIGIDKPSPMREQVVAHVDELRDAGFTVIDLPTGHFPMRSMPNALTALLLTNALAVPSDSE